MITNYYHNNKKTLDEFHEEITNISKTAQDKFFYEIEDYLYYSTRRFHDLLMKELSQTLVSSNLKSAFTGMRFFHQTSLFHSFFRMLERTNL
ncbi:hypothetical protein [Wolbachia endosymbiont of Pentidionis agamae]|uniref:hypothetical protein n=1 Tax=Wolbachia endosymbiont of Pentidionis agamae TaxID=3110435 RepID=UPI002FD4EB59